MPTINWLGKEFVVTHDRKVTYHVLNHVYNFGGTSENKIIHGDNLLALKSLLPLYESKVKCIYIDPPYNTGNEGWIYNDNVNSPQIQKWLGQVVGKEGEDFSRHDKWLCMMYPRLKLLKQLLADDGAIFISIDDNEQANLKLICDEIFGRQNFIAQLVWEKKKKGAFLSKILTNIKEYVIVYCKSINNFSGLIGEINKATETYPCINAVNKRERRIIPKGIESKYKEKNFFLPAGTKISDTTMNILYLTDLVIEDGIVVKDFEIEGNWRYSQDLMTQYAFNKELYVTRDLYLRRIVNEPRYKMLKDILSRVGDDKNKSYDSEVDLDNLFADGWGSNEDADEELRLILGKQKLFEYPKPMKLILKLLCSLRDKNSIVLDAFAGSGTTAHAVLNLNKVDGGNRKFILIEMEDYAENITAERVRRIGGNFDFYEIGEPLFIEDELNENIPLEKIREYVWTIDTRTKYVKPTGDCEEFLGIDEGSAYYYYEGILDREFLAKIKTRADSYIIYAESCVLSEEFMLKYKIEFRKIPRDFIKV